MKFIESNNMMKNIKELQDLKFELFIQSGYQLKYQLFGVFAYMSKEYGKEIDLVNEYEIYKRKHKAVNMTDIAIEILKKYPNM